MAQARGDRVPTAEVLLDAIKTNAGTSLYDPA